MHLDLPFALLLRIVRVAGARRPFAPVGHLAIDHGKIRGSLLLLTVEGVELSAGRRRTKLHVRMNADAWLEGGQRADGRCSAWSKKSGREVEESFSKNSRLTRILIGFITLFFHQFDNSNSSLKFKL